MQNLGFSPDVIYLSTLPDLLKTGFPLNANMNEPIRSQGKNRHLAMVQSAGKCSYIELLPGGGGGTPYNGLYGEAPPKRGTFFRLQVYKRVGISRAEVL